MLMPMHGVFERDARSPANRRPARTVLKAKLAVIKRFCLCAAAVLLAGAALTAIMALKLAIYLFRFNY
jgi:hypothetical protein